MATISVKNFELTSDTIIAAISNGTQEIDYSVNRLQFEHFTSGGIEPFNRPIIGNDNGMETVVDCFVTLADYWNGAEINDTTIIEDLTAFLNEPAQLADIRSKMIEDAILDLVPEKEKDMVRFHLINYKALHYIRAIDDGAVSVNLLGAIDSDEEHFVTTEQAA